MWISIALKATYLFQVYMGSLVTTKYTLTNRKSNYSKKVFFFPPHNRVQRCVIYVIWSKTQHHYYCWVPLSPPILWQLMIISLCFPSLFELAALAYRYKWPALFCAKLSIIKHVKVGGRMAGTVKGKKKSIFRKHMVTTEYLIKLV